MIEQDTIQEFQHALDYADPRKVKEIAQAHPSILQHTFGYRYTNGRPPEQMTPAEFIYAAQRRGYSRSGSDGNFLSFLRQGCTFNASKFRRQKEGKFPQLNDHEWIEERLFDTAEHCYEVQSLGRIDAELQKKDDRHRPRLIKPGTTPDAKGAITVNPEFLDYLECLAIAAKVCQTQASKEESHLREEKSLAVEILSATRGNWSDIRTRLGPQAMLQAKDVRDTMRELSDHLILPHLLDSVGPAMLAMAHDHKIDLDNAYSYKFLSQHMDLPLMKVIFSNVPLEHVLALSQQWHDRRGDIFNWAHETPETPREHKTIEKSTLAWHPLIEADMVVESGPAKGYIIHCLRNSTELKAEAKKMDHCIDGAHYHEKGFNGTSHYFSIRDPQGSPVSTLEARWSRKNNILTAKQHRAQHDHAPSSKALAAVAELEKFLAEDKIKTAEHSGATEETKVVLEELLPASITRCGWQMRSPISEYANKAFNALCGLKPEDENGMLTPTSVLRVGRNTHLIPEKYHGHTAQQFIRETGLAEALENNLRKLDHGHFADELKESREQHTPATSHVARQQARRPGQIQRG